MIFNEDELITILKKHLPQTPAKDLESVARSILEESQHWQEVDLYQHLHDDVEEDLLQRICRRHAEDVSPKKVRMFYKS